jgi:uncharacterized membrane-anchored protein
MDWSVVLSSAVAGSLAVWFARRLARERAAAREGRRGRVTAGGIGQVVMLLFGLGTAVGAIFADGVQARNLAIAALIMLGVFALSVRADHADRDQRRA